MVLHKLRFHPDFVAPFSPPCEGGVAIFPPLRILVLRFSAAPKGPKQESPGGGNPACGVGPGDPIRMRIRPALKGRNKILDHKPVLPLQGVASLNTRSNSQGDALGWHVAAPTGRNSGSATSKFARGGEGIARSRRHSIARNKSTRLRIVPAALSTSTFHRPRAGDRAPGFLTDEVAKPRTPHRPLREGQYAHNSPL